MAWVRMGAPSTAVVKPVTNPSIAQLPDYSPQTSSDATKLLAFGPDFDDSSLTKLLDKLGGTGLTLYRHQPIAELPVAVVIEGLDAKQWSKSNLEALANELAIELVLVSNPPAINRPGVLVMDMDSTAIEIECIDEIAKLAGVGEKVAALTRESMEGKLDFAQSLTRRVATLKDADETILGQVADSMPLMPGLASLVDTLKVNGWVVAMASGGFTYFTDKLKAQLGLSAAFANELAIENGKLTGEVKGDIVDAQVKADVVQQLAKEHGIAPEQTVAVGDGANDLIMLGQAALGVAFHAKPVVQQQAKAGIKQGRLDQLLYLLLPQA